MSMRTKIRNWLMGEPKTIGYEPIRSHAFTQPRTLPIFSFDIIRSMLIDPTVCLGLAMRSAPLTQAEFAYQGRNGEWIPGVLADRPDVSVWVLRQLRRIWEFELQKILQAQVWGWSAGEVTYRLVDGRVSFDRILQRAPEDVTALTHSGEMAGVRFKRIRKIKDVDLRFPKAFWHAYDAENESPYGRSALRGSYSSWADKWLDGGALDVRRLFMHKDAYGGVDMTYPPGTTLVGGQEKPNRDIAREIVEQIKAGGVTTRPSEYDQTGKALWELTRASIPANPMHILEYPKNLDVEILRGMEIPDDVLLSQATGAWQGKQVPMLAFFVNADRWLSQVIQTITTQILEPMVMLNWGKAIDFEVRTKPLAEQAMEQMQPEQQEEPQRMSLEQMVGRGVFDASEIVRKAREITPKTNGRYRMAQERAPIGGIVIQGKRYKGGEFIPAEVIEQATAQERKALDKGQASAGKLEKLLESKSESDAKAFRAAKEDGIAIPPAWTEVEYHGADQDIIAEGRDAKGRRQRLENPEFRRRQILAKHERIAKGVGARMDDIRAKLRDAAAKGEEEDKVLYLISMTGFRIGSSRDTKADKEAFGASTLLGRHVSVDGDVVRFDFPGKKGVRQQHEIEDGVIADFLRDASGEDPVFDTNDRKVRQAWKAKYGGKKVHDIRNVVATETARKALSRLIPPVPKSKSQFKKIQKRVAEEAARKLGNRPSEALGTYINPSVFSDIDIQMEAAA